MDAYQGNLDMVPDMVKQFVVYFYRHIRERNILQIGTMYDKTFVTLTERFYKNVPWPPVELLAPLVDHDHVFCMLYKEMYFRHLYAVQQPSLEARCESWANYQALFGVILHSNVNMQLPNGWLWDIIDEFVYQFQSFAQYRGKLAQKTAEELDTLRTHEDVWSVLGVLNYLQALVDNSGIVAELSAPGAMQRFNDTEGYNPRESNVLRMLGYFSLIGLQRVHTLVGDYHGALKAIYPLNLFETRHSFTPRIAGCHISLFYYGGFCYLMSRRYLDAARAFNTVLAYIQRVKNFHQRSSQFEQILKKNEQMFALLALTAGLCPAATRVLDESVLILLQDKNGDNIQRLVRGDVSTADERFTYACPKFITAAAPNFDAPGTNTNQEAYRLQLKMFLGLVAQQQHLPPLKQLLQLYTLPMVQSQSISLSKLAGLMDMDVTSLRSQLMLLKQVSSCKTWTGKGDATEGELIPAADLTFTIDTDPATGQETISVTELKQARRQDGFLAEDITKFAQIVSDLSVPIDALQAGAGAVLRPQALPAY